MTSEIVDFKSMISRLKCQFTFPSCQAYNPSVVTVYPSEPNGFFILIKLYISLVVKSNKGKRFASFISVGWLG